MDAFITCGVQLIRMVTFLDIMVQSKRDRKAQEVPSQATKRLTVCSACHHHRQAAELQCGEGRSAAGCRALTRKVSEQPGGEFSSANQVAGTGDETFQVSGTRAAFSFDLRN